MSERYEWGQLKEDIGRVLAVADGDREIIDGVKPLLKRLLERDDLIPQNYSRPLPHKYAQYLLYKPEDEAFSVIAFIWGPGQVAPVHDHLVWGLVGVYEGSLVEKRYRREASGLDDETGELRYAVREVGEVQVERGHISFVYPPDHDIHGVANPTSAQAITVHIYGTDIGRQSRHIYDTATGQLRDVVTRHDNETAIYDGARSV